MRFGSLVESCFEVCREAQRNRDGQEGRAEREVGKN